MAIPFLSPDDKMLEILDKGIREYEERYEMPSEDMLKALSDGSERETAEKLRWMFDYRVWRYLTEERTRTTGTPGTPTSTSTSDASLSIPS